MRCLLLLPSLSVDLLGGFCSLDEDSFDLGTVALAVEDVEEELCGLSLCSEAGLELLLDLSGVPELELMGLLLLLLLLLLGAEAEG